MSTIDTKFSIENGTKDSLPQIALESIPDEVFSELEFEVNLMRSIITNGRSNKAIETVCQLMGYHRSTFNRRFKEFEKTGQLTALLRKPRTPEKRRSRLLPEQEDIIEHELQKFLKHSPNAPIQAFVVSARDAIADAELDKVHDRTIRRRYERLSEEERVKRTHGTKIAHDNYDMIEGSTPETFYPLERVQIDHTLGDVWIVSEDTREPIGRPWVTIAMDECTRTFVALHVGLDDPSSVVFAATMARIALPKDEWLRDLGVKTVCQFHGKPTGTYLDNAAEFHAAANHRGCAAWGINPPEFRMGGRPEWGGIIERAMGILMDQTHMIKGSTRQDLLKIKRDEKFDPVKHATMTLREYEAFLAEYIYCQYHHKVHSGINTTPAEKWRRCVEGYKGQIGTGRPPQIDDAEKFYIDFLPSQKRVLSPGGIHLNNHKYRSSKLKPLMKRGKRIEYEVKYDPNEMSRAYLYDPAPCEYIPLHPVGLRWPHISTGEWDVLHDADLALNKSLEEENEANARASRNRQRGLQKTAKAKTKSAKVRRNQEKKREGERRRKTFAPAEPVKDLSPLKALEVFEVQIFEGRTR